MVEGLVQLSCAECLSGLRVGAVTWWDVRARWARVAGRCENSTIVIMVIMHRV